jgi:hypothetical protein
LLAAAKTEHDPYLRFEYDRLAVAVQQLLANRPGRSAFGGVWQSDNDFDYEDYGDDVDDGDEDDEDFIDGDDDDESDDLADLLGEDGEIDEEMLEAFQQAIEDVPMEAVFDRLRDLQRFEPEVIGEVTSRISILHILDWKEQLLLEHAGKSEAWRQEWIRELVDTFDFTDPVEYECALSMLNSFLRPETSSAETAQLAETEAFGGVGYLEGDMGTPSGPAASRPHLGELDAKERRAERRQRQKMLGKSKKKR